MSFVIRKLNEGETLGEKLTAMRKAANLTLSELAEKTKIQKSYLKAFEEAAYDKLPEPVYARKFLKKYVKALGGNASYFLQCFENERGTCDFLKGSRMPRQRTRIWNFISASRFVKIGVFAAFIIALSTYLGLQVQALIAPPEITIIEPADGFITEDATIKIIGNTEDEVNVMVNGNKVLLSEDGRFEAVVALERGINIITIEGSKRYSRITTIHRRVILDQEQKSFGFH